MNVFRGKLGKQLDNILQVNYPDPTLARRGRLLNILLLGSGLAGIFAILATAVVALGQGALYPDDITVLVSAAIGVVSIAGLYALNRSRSPRLAAFLFVLGLIFILSLSDQPQQVVSGRATVALVLPIIMASVLLGPSASFVVAAVVGLTLLILARTTGLNPGPLLLETVEFLLVALVGWLAARSLENALAELRAVNRELDHRVAERTRDLGEALIRVQAESGKNQAILESIADGVIVFDEHGQATVANPAIGHLLDLGPDQILGHEMEALMAGAVNAAERETLATLLRDTTQRHPNLRLQWAKKTLSASFAPVRAGDDTHSGTVGVFRDFTREAELDRMKSVFVSMVSHELRTPLNAVLGYGEMLSEHVYGPLSEKQSNIIERLITNTKRLLSLVGDLLDRTQMEAGQLSLRNVVFSPAALVDDMSAAVSEIARAKALELTTYVADDVPDQLRGDPQRLTQILINLVGNAIKFTDRGKISVRITRPDASHWALEVSDTGTGIPLEEQPYIFDWFRQVDSSATRQHAGVGLGLSIVKQLVMLMQGEVKLKSQVGQGSTFTILLPLMTAQEKTS